MPQRPHAARDRVIVISIHDQRLALLEDGAATRVYIVSTARSGVGETTDSDTTPRGRHAIAEKIGAGAPIGMVFEGREPTGEIVQVNTPGRWPVATRILRLRGLEKRNANTFERLIYIHGSPVEKLLGSPASGGCIRMKSADVVELFDLVRVGTEVAIHEEPLSSAIEAVRELAIH
jgi:lipoprotein-anchoring transpeptidase ErfK/SrfK